MASTFRCGTCGHVAHRWFGRCPECGGWSSAVPESSDGGPALRLEALVGATDVSARLVTDVAEVDRVLGGGLVPGSVVLVAGEPGVGKSTLLLQIADAIAANGGRSLYVTGEETLGQLSSRGARIGIGLERCTATAATDLRSVIATVEQQRPEVLVVDSIQTLRDPDLDHAAGSSVQVRECAAALVVVAKATDTTVLLAGHVTKDGNVAGPKTLEHVVDTVLSLEGDRTGSLRLLRGVKNRFGSCDETGVFTMTARGLQGVGDPSAMLLADRLQGVPGSTVVAALEGSRPVLVEIQALCVESSLPQPRRVAIGVDSRRLTVLLALLAKHDLLSGTGHDVFVAATGGLAVREPAADLAICLAICSAVEHKPIGDRVVAIGEVGLAGETRRVPNIDRRLAEAARHGFTRAIAPRATPDSTDIEVVQAASLRRAVDVALKDRAAERQAS